MKKILQDIRVQKLCLPLAFLMILCVWCVAKWADPYHPLCYIATGLGVFFYIMDRQLKPREKERAERKQRRMKSNEHISCSD